MRLLAIDPGPTESAGVEMYPDGAVGWHAKLPNDDMLGWIDGGYATHLAIEMVASYGMPVGADVFETVFWAGRFAERWEHTPEASRVTPATLVFRRDVKLHLCASPRANDANIRQALIDRYGPGKQKAVGVKATPGPLYGLTSDRWAALGVAVTAMDTRLQVAA